jgi:hypothetical protein
MRYGKSPYITLIRFVLKGLNLKVHESKLFLTFQLSYCPKVNARDQLNTSLGDLQSRSLGLVEEQFRYFYRESNLGLHGYTVMCITKTNRKKRQQWAVLRYANYAKVLFIPAAFN